ncbi:hypothetical protein [Parafrankia discariae]|uniref:hypothetical protein n=1 Tax=Parafrankia discariae TaxID=365528 RepID=UPI000373F4B0|nr:hypothetical protein [Parafrankia discariae]
MPDRGSPDRRGSRGATGTDSQGQVSRISKLFTREADEHAAYLASRYDDHQRRLRPHTQGSEFFAEVAELDGLTYARTSYTKATVETICPAMPMIFVGHLHAGRYHLRWRGGEMSMVGKGVMLFPPGGFTHLNDCTDNSVVTVRLDVVLRVAEESSGLNRDQVRFTGVTPISENARRQWLATAAYARHAGR